MADASSQIIALVMQARSTANDSIRASNASMGERSYAAAYPLVQQAASLYSSAVVTLNKSANLYNGAFWTSPSDSLYASQVINHARAFLGTAWTQLQYAEDHLQGLPKPGPQVPDRRYVANRGVHMNPQKMFNRVAPTLTPRGLRALSGASPGLQATLLSGVDVGVVRANIEGLAGFAEAKGLTLDGMVEIGSANPGLGSYSTAADSAQSARNNALNANSESAKAKQAKTRADATPHLNNAKQFIQTAINQNNAAMNDYSGTDPSSDSSGVDTGVAQGAIISAQSAIAAAQANYNAAATYAQNLPASGGGGTPPPKTCPAGQHLDATGNCVPDTVAPATAAKSTSWWLIGAGVLAAGVIAVVVTQPSEEEKKAAGKRKLKAA